MTAAMPSTVPTTTQLYGDLVDNLSTFISAGGLTAVATTINVDDTTDWPNVGLLSIRKQGGTGNVEVCSYTGKTATTFTGVTRNVNGRYNDTFYENDVVEMFWTAEHHNRHAEETIAIAQNISTRMGLGTTQIKAPNGAAAGPTYAYTNNTDMGFYRQAADTQSWAVGGTEMVRWAANNFWFGTTLSNWTSGTSFQWRMASANASAAHNIAVVNDFNSSSFAANAFFAAQVGGATTAGDPSIKFIVSGVTTFAVGIDNDDSDKFKISGSATLGSSDWFSITTGGDVSIAAAKKLYLDGGSNTYIHEAAADRIELVTNSNVRLRCDNGFMSILGVDLYIPTTKKLFLDGGSDTYIYESSDNVIQFGMSSSNLFQMSSSGLQISTTSSNAILAQAAVSGNIYGFFVDNTSNTASSDARIAMRVAGTSAGDPYLLFSIVSGSPSSWSMGVDNSDGDKFKINNSATLSTGSTVEINSSNQFLLLDGTNALPTHSFINDPDSGMYSSAANVLGFCSGGSLKWTIGSNLSAVNGSLIRNSDGNGGGPGYAFDLDSDTGMYRSNTNELAFSTGGTGRLTISTTIINSTIPIQLPNSVALKGTTSGAAAVDLISIDSGDHLTLNANSTSLRIQNAVTQTTIGANGAASALTALPVGYVKVQIGGVDKIMPYYNA